MSDRPRAFEPLLARSLREFPVTTVIGLRQSGKTTLVRRAPGRRAWVTLDDLSALSAARRDPEGFLRGLPRPLTIDEVQRVPELLLPIKREVDRRPKPGQFLLTGSARIEMRRGVTETLAGRGSLLRLRPMTWAEAAGRASWNPVDLLFSSRSVADAASRFPDGRPMDGSRVLAGGLPIPLLRRRGGARRRWLDEYHAAYVQRDVPPLVQIDQVAPFVRFISLAAARTAQTTNHAMLARETGVSADTGLRWFGVLESTFLADPVPPWFRNIGKRLVKAPKLHFGDAGLAARMAGVVGWADARRQNLAGALVETLVAQHLLVFAECGRQPAQVFHYRTHAGAEVDFVLARGRRLVPVEVKSSSKIDARDLSGMRSFLSDFRREAPFGVVLYTGPQALPVGRGIVALPMTTFLEGPGNPSRTQGRQVHGGRRWRS